MSQPTAIILGASVSPDGTASPALMRRARHGAMLYLEGRVGVVIASGGVVRNPPSEATLIEAICTDLGVPIDRIQREDESTTTLENIRFSKPLLAGSDIPVVIVTDLYHAPRARLAAKRLGLNATTSSPSLKGYNPLRILKAYLREIPAYLLYLVTARQR